MRITFRRIVSVIAGLAFTTMLVVSRRNAAMDRLYGEAAGHGLNKRPAEARAAVRKLAEYRGSRSAGMLLAVALDIDGTGMIQAQTEAIEALRTRGDPDAAVELAHLLRPHRYLDVRSAVAGTLRVLPCGEECLVAVLDYLERVWRGELNSEDRLPLKAYNDRERADYQRQQQALYAELDAVLKQNRESTLVCLEQLYGLGHPDVSIFALQLASRLQMREACPSIMESEESANMLPAHNFPRKEIQEAAAALKCQ